MILKDSLNDFNLYIKGFEIESIGNSAIKKVHEENHKLGIPLVYSVDGMIYYELADGTVTKKTPFSDGDTKGDTDGSGQGEAGELH